MSDADSTSSSGGSDTWALVSKDGELESDRDSPSVSVEDVSEERRQPGARSKSGRPLFILRLSSRDSASDSDIEEIPEELLSVETTQDTTLFNTYQPLGGSSSPIESLIATDGEDVLFGGGQEAYQGKIVKSHGMVESPPAKRSISDSGMVKSSDSCKVKKDLLRTIDRSHSMPGAESREKETYRAGEDLEVKQEKSTESDEESNRDETLTVESPETTVQEVQDIANKEVVSSEAEVLRSAEATSVPVEDVLSLEEVEIPSTLESTGVLGSLGVISLDSEGHSSIEVIRMEEVQEAREEIQDEGKSETLDNAAAEDVQQQVENEAADIDKVAEQPPPQEEPLGTPAAELEGQQEPVNEPWRISFRRCRHVFPRWLLHISDRQIMGAFLFLAAAVAIGNFTVHHFHGRYEDKLNEVRTSLSICQHSLRSVEALHEGSEGRLQDIYEKRLWEAQEMQTRCQQNLLVVQDQKDKLIQKLKQDILSLKQEGEFMKHEIRKYRQAQYLHDWNTHDVGTQTDELHPQMTEASTETDDLHRQQQTAEAFTQTDKIKIVDAQTQTDHSESQDAEIQANEKASIECGNEILEDYFVYVDDVPSKDTKTWDRLKTDKCGNLMKYVSQKEELEDIDIIHGTGSAVISKSIPLITNSNLDCKSSFPLSTMIVQPAGLIEYFPVNETALIECGNGKLFFDADKFCYTSPRYNTMVKEIRRLEEKTQALIGYIADLTGPDEQRYPETLEHLESMRKSWAESAKRVEQERNKKTESDNAEKLQKEKSKSPNTDRKDESHHTGEKINSQERKGSDRSDAKKRRENFRNKRDQKSEEREQKNKTEDRRNNENNGREKEYRKTRGKAWGSSHRDGSSQDSDGKDRKQEEKEDCGSFTECMLKMVDKTRESVMEAGKHMQDTWDQVKNASRDFMDKHESTVHNFQEKFTKNLVTISEHITNKVHKFSDRFHEKLNKKWRKWGKWFNREEGQHKGRTNGPERAHSGSEEPERESFQSGQWKETKSSESFHDEYHYQGPQEPQKSTDEVEKETQKEKRLKKKECKKECKELKRLVGDLNMKKVCGMTWFVVDKVYEKISTVFAKHKIDCLDQQDFAWMECQESWWLDLSVGRLNPISLCHPHLKHFQIRLMENMKHCLQKPQKFCRNPNSFLCSGKFDGFDGNGQSESEDESEAYVEVDEPEDEHGEDAKHEDLNEKDDEVANDEVNDWMFRRASDREGHHQQQDEGTRSNSDWLFKRASEREAHRFPEDDKEDEDDHPTDWMFERAKEREFDRTNPDDWYFRRAEKHGDYKREKRPSCIDL